MVQAYEACRAVLAEQLGVDPALETIDAYLAAIGAATEERPGAVSGGVPGGPRGCRSRRRPSSDVRPRPPRWPPRSGIRAW